MSFFRSFRYALSGIMYCFLSERNMRIHTVISLYVLFFARFYDFSCVQYILIVLTIASVMSVEMINTAFEKICDKISQKKNFMIKIVKDLAAGAVLINATAAFIIGAIFFFQVDKVILIYEYFVHSWLRSILFILSLIGSIAFIMIIEYYEKEFENFLKFREENFEKD